MESRKVVALPDDPAGEVYEAHTFTADEILAISRQLNAQGFVVVTTEQWEWLNKKP